MFQQRIVESRPNAASVHELTIHIIGKLQRPKVSAGPLWRSESDNHKVGGRLCLDLEPAVRPSLCVFRVGLLGDDSFEAQLLHALHERNAFALDVIERAQGAYLREKFREKGFAQT